jgi:hypothetical protein
MHDLATACAWHLAMIPPQLVPLAGTTVEQALAALEDRTLSHGICPSCAAALRARHALVAPRGAR